MHVIFTIVKKRAYKENGLSRLIFSNAEARFIYYRIQCLPLLPHEHIKNEFLQLKNEAYAINKKIFQPFIRYWDRQWIQNVCNLFFLIFLISFETVVLHVI